MNPILACGSIGLTTADLLLILGVLVAWLLSFLLFIPNFVLIFRCQKSIASLFRHLGFMLAYVGLAAGLFLAHGRTGNSIGWADLAETLIFAVPPMVISHFIYLTRTWRKARRKTSS